MRGHEEQDLARQIAGITRREPDVLARSVREIRVALREGRVALRTDASGLVAFLFLHRYLHRYGNRYEAGTGWVRSDARRRGLFLALHHELFARVPAGSVVFGFPGNTGVRRAMEKLGFRRASYQDLPWRVWMRMAVGRLTPLKLVSLLRSVRHGTVRTSRELWILTLPPNQGSQDDEDDQAGQGPPSKLVADARQQ